MKRNDYVMKDNLMKLLSMNGCMATWHPLVNALLKDLVNNVVELKEKVDSLEKSIGKDELVDISKRQSLKSYLNYRGNLGYGRVELTKEYSGDAEAKYVSLFIGAKEYAFRYNGAHHISSRVRYWSVDNVFSEEESTVFVEKCLERIKDKDFSVFHDFDIANVKTKFGYPTDINKLQVTEESSLTNLYMSQFSKNSINFPNREEVKALDDLMWYQSDAEFNKDSKSRMTIRKILDTLGVNRFYIHKNNTSKLAIKKTIELLTTIGIVIVDIDFSHTKDLYKEHLSFKAYTKDTNIVICEYNGCLNGVENISPMLNIFDPTDGKWDIENIDGMLSYSKAKKFIKYCLSNQNKVSLQYTFTDEDFRIPSIKLVREYLKKKK